MAIDEIKMFDWVNQKADEAGDELRASKSDFDKGRLVAFMTILCEFSKAGLEVDENCREFPSVKTVGRLSKNVGNLPIPSFSLVEEDGEYMHYSGEKHEAELEKKLNDAKLRVKIGHPSQFVVLGPIEMAKDRKWLVDQIKPQQENES